MMKSGKNAWNKGLLVLVIILGMINLGYSFSACNVNLDEPWFIVNDSTGSDVLIADSEGDIFLRGTDHSSNNKDIYESFEVGNNIFFNRETSYFSSFNAEVSLLPTAFENGVIVRNNSGNEVSFLSETGGVHTKGKGVYQGSQAGCNADGWHYCSGKTKQNRDYFCEITGERSGACDYNLLNSYSCSNDNYYYCDGDNRYEAIYDCSGGSCYHDHNTFIETCTAPSTDYSSWSCDDSDTRVRTKTTYSASCSSGSCDVDSTSVQEYDNCEGGKVCSGGSCICDSHDYKSCYNNDAYWYDSCGNREDKANECGSDSCGSWGSWYCKDSNTKKRDRTCYDRGCSGSSCYSSSYTDSQTDSCGSGMECSGGSCVSSCGGCSGCQSCSGGSCVDDDSNCGSGIKCKNASCCNYEINNGYLVYGWFEYENWNTESIPLEITIAWDDSIIYSKYHEDSWPTSIVVGNYEYFPGETKYSNADRDEYEYDAEVCRDKVN